VCVLLCFVFRSCFLFSFEGIESEKEVFLYFSSGLSIFSLPFFFSRSSFFLSLSLSLAFMYDDVNINNSVRSVVNDILEYTNQKTEEERGKRKEVRDEIVKKEEENRGERVKENEEDRRYMTEVHFPFPLFFVFIYLFLFFFCFFCSFSSRLWSSFSLFLSLSLLIFEPSVSPFCFCFYFMFFLLIMFSFLFLFFRVRRR